MLLLMCIKIIPQKTLGQWTYVIAAKYVEGVVCASSLLYLSLSRHR